MKTKKFFILDLTKVDHKQLPDIFKKYLFVPCVEGTFCYDFDLLEDEVPEWFLKERRVNADSLSFYNFQTSFSNQERDFMPLGFNEYQLPTGAKMIEVTK